VFITAYINIQAAFQYSIQQCRNSVLLQHTVVYKLCFSTVYRSIETMLQYIVRQYRNSVSLQHTAVYTQWFSTPYSIIQIVFQYNIQQYTNCVSVNRSVVYTQRFFTAYSSIMFHYSTQQYTISVQHTALYCFSTVYNNILILRKTVYSQGATKCPCTCVSVSSLCL